MKKTLFLFVLIAAASQLKAQSLPTPLFNNLLVPQFGNLSSDYFSKNYFNKTSDSLKTAKHYQQLFMEDEKNKRFLNQYAYNPMPVVKLNGYSKMPIIKLDINSKMPVINPDKNDLLLSNPLGTKP